ncbi:MAG: hypothetical protein ACK5PZ_09780, partial [Pirellula sp.]
AYGIRSTPERLEPFFVDYVDLDPPRGQHLGSVDGMVPWASRCGDESESTKVSQRDWVEGVFPGMGLSDSVASQRAGGSDTFHRHRLCPVTELCLGWPF